jgi:hypothetical protein
MQIQTDLVNNTSAPIASALDIAGRAKNLARNAGKYEIIITSGVHEGARITCDPGTVSIGSGMNNDAVLFGEDIAEEHVKLVLPINVLKDIEIVPTQDAVEIDGAGFVEVGQFAHISSDQTIRLGDVDVLIKRVGDPKSMMRPAIRVFAFICVLAIVPLAWGVFSGFALTAADASGRIINAIHSGVSEASQSVLGSKSINLSEDTNAFAWTTRTKIEDLKLNHRVRVKGTPDGSIRVTGTISDTDVPAWTAFLQWYDSNPGLPPLIRDVVRKDIAGDVPQVSSVWIDENPTAVFKDGTVAGIGSRVQNGWTVVAVSNQSVTLERDGAYVNLTF